MVADSPLLSEAVDGVLRLTLNRPNVGNAFDLDLAHRFRDAVQSALADPAVAVIVVGAEGRLFCAGGDVAAMCAASDVAAYVVELANTLAEAMLALNGAGAVVIAEVAGAAAGAGLGVVLNADLVLASSRASFLSAYAGVGFVPDAGVSRKLPELVGPRRALELTVGDRVLTAEEAATWGIVNEVHADVEALRGRADELAAHIAAGPTAVLASTKRLLASRAEPYEEHLSAEVEGLIAALGTHDTRARLAAFVARRAER